ncbi:hypothetical protein [Janthinobacterium sp. HLS12-2]|uniref:hypothetical protein n=1 Tax=Janthinobacterium sp. HLS12-2 TaxID=1259324 RepID=UPI003F1FA704
MESVANSFPREVCENALAHSLPDKVKAAYRRDDLLEKLSLLMQVWSNYCSAPQAPVSVTPRGSGIEIHVEANKHARFYCAITFGSSVQFVV